MKHVVVKKLNFLRLPRLAILASMMIYACLLLVYYRRSLPLKIDRSSMMVEEDSGRVMEKLLMELDQNDDDQSDRDADEAEDPEEQDNRDARRLLEEIFAKADVDEDDQLDIRELAMWIHGRITDHIDRAMRENIGLFTAIDNNPRNGKTVPDFFSN